MPMLLARNWWSFVIRGVAAIIFGVLTFMWPGITLLALIYLFGAYALVDGVLNLIGAFERTAMPGRWWMLLVEGIVGVLAGLIAFVAPGLTGLALLFLIAFWAILTGALEIGAAIHLRRHITGEWLLALAGAWSVILGLLLVVWPGAGALAVAMIVGAYAVVFGIVLISLGLRLRRFAHGEAREMDMGMPMPG